MKKGEDMSGKGWKMFFCGVLLSYFLYYLKSVCSFEVWGCVFCLLIYPILYLVIGGLDYIFGGEELESDFIDWVRNSEKYKW